MARTVEEGHVSRRRAAAARISASTCPTTLGGYFKQFPMQQLSALLQIPSWSDCPHESPFKIGVNSNTRQSSSATKDSHYFAYLSCVFVLPPRRHFEMSHAGIVWFEHNAWREDDNILLCVAEAFMRPCEGKFRQAAWPKKQRQSVKRNRNKRQPP